MPTIAAQPATTAWPEHAPALQLLELPTRLQVPLTTRAIAEPIHARESGTRVKRGERLSDSPVESSAVALAPTSGRIIGTSVVELLNGHRVAAVDIEPDYEDRPLPEEDEAAHTPEHHKIFDALADVHPSDLPDWIDRLRGAGIWADRPASPDLLSQLHMALRRPIDTILCTLFDDDAAMRLNAILGARSGAMLLAGVHLLSKLTEARNVWLVSETGAPKRWWVPIKRMGRKVEIEMLTLQNDYPQNDPTLLIYTTLGRRLRPGRVPTEQGALLIDGALAVAIGRQALRQQPMLQVPVAVHDHLRNEVSFVVAPIGMPVRQLLQQVGSSAEDACLLRGNVLRENKVSPDAVISGGELVLHVLARPKPLLAEPCVRCGWCVEGCPTRVQPAGLLEAAQRQDLALADHYGIDACIECGVCTYVCPSNLPILAGIRKLKADSKKV